MTPLTSALYVGSVGHRRHRPRANRFRYRTYHALIDLEELPRLDREVAGFGYRRAAVTSFHDVDHFGPEDLPSREKLRRRLDDRGVALPSGPVRVLTNLRVLGHVFNPVSWWFCYDGGGALAMVVAEVNNTFGESHAYVLEDLVVGQHGIVRARTGKAFHVSPFLTTDGLEYGFTFAVREDRILVHMDVRDHEGRLLDAVQDGHRREFTGRQLAAVLVTHPLMTVRTVWLIHWQAVRLWWKRVPFVPRPIGPAEVVSPRAGSRRAGVRDAVAGHGRATS